MFNIHSLGSFTYTRVIRSNAHAYTEIRSFLVGPTRNSRNFSDTDHIFFRLLILKYKIALKIY